MQLIARLSRTKVARIAGLALLSAMAITYIGSIKAATPVEFTVRVFEGDPANHVMVGGASITLAADDAGNASNGRTATTDSMGVAVFSNVDPGAFNVQIRHSNYYDKDYHMLIDSNTELDATLVSFTPPPPPPASDVCTPTPPRGQPMFNIWPIAETGANCTDYPLLAAQNVTRGGSYSHALSASNGDTIKVRLYVHNGVLDYPENEAINAMVAAHLPAASGSITAEAWANNANRVTSAQKGGDVAVTLGASNEFLEYVPGSAKVYSRGPALIGTFSDSVVSGGASLGNMRGCYEFLRFVTFEVKVKAQTVVVPGNISIQKTVRNVSRGESAFVKTVNASPSEQVEFRMQVSATNGAVSNVNVSDNLPGLLSYVTGSLTVDGAAAGNNLNSIGLGNMNNNSKTIQFKANVASSSQFSGTITLTNNATVTSNSGNDQDSASVVVTITPPSNPTLSIQKTVRNVSRGESAFAKTTNASPSEQVEFEISVSSATATARNVTVSDALPSDLHLNFISNSNGTGSVLSSIPLGDIAAGTAKTFRITATAGPETSFPIGDTTLTNVATAFADNAASKSDSANVVVRRAQVVNPNLNIDKRVRNVSRSETQFVKTASAAPGEQVEFEIRVTAGSATARNVVLTDTLPDHFSLAFVNMDSGVTRSSNLNFNLGDMTAGTSKTVKITANLDGENSFPTGTTSWINRATASADNAGAVTSEATVNVTRGSVVQNAQLNIVKLVRNINSGNSFSHSTSAQTNDVLEFQITVSNVGGATANNVRVNDNIPSQISYRDATMRLNGSYSGSNIYGNVLNVSLGNLTPGQTATIIFQVTVLVSNVQTTVTNTATASADNAGQVSDSASVFLSSVRGTDINLILSKRAYNNTQNQDATTVTARPGDVITYTLSVQNNGTADATSYVFQDDLSDILQLSELGNFSGGNFDTGHLSLSWPAVTIPASGKVEKTFTVTVRETFPAGTDFVMTNTFGNTVNVRVRGPFTAPATGNPTTISLVLSGLVAASFAAYRRGKLGFLAKFLRNN
ncbi:MAG: hypothetical protein ACM3NH_04595 [Candidatus Saccharibacteria bacterium]